MNFAYLENLKDLTKLHRYCADAERLVNAIPYMSVATARKAMEYIVKLLYSSAVGQAGVGSTLQDMLTDPAFVAYIGDQTIINTFHIIRKMGNVALHEDEKISKADSMNILEQLHFLVGEVCILLGLLEDYPEFDSELIKRPSPKPVAQPKPEPVPEPEVTVEQEVIAKFAPHLRHVRFNVSLKRDETENKRLFLLSSLRDAGWAVVSQPNQAMPGYAGVDMILNAQLTSDYILYGRDNLPLAIIEFTATSANLVAGRAKGIELADALFTKHGTRPMVYYTNGYHIFCIDPLGYKPRRVFNFHSLEELELLKLRATIRGDITTPLIDDAITNRDYQKEAIKAMCGAFSSMRRHSLLVMATGTGKTRVSISCVDILMKANWVKNVLFLADRTSLVHQAHKNFNKLLPNVTTSIYSMGSMKRDINARVIFSTYQSMIRFINDDSRKFGIGRFDLIIIDEAHRSIFKKYNALFHYFDALMLGLTATPRNEDNKSTYEIFELPDGHPDYSYDLETAVKDGYLVGFSVLDRTTAALQRGISYNDLSSEEQAQFEDTFAEDEEEKDFTGAVIEKKKINTSVVNLATIDAMLADLIKNGLKIDGGDRLGKTIIFAKSHNQAEYIVERFNKYYSHFGADFCKLITSEVQDSLQLIETFEQRGSPIQVATSVDMMSTGVDVPDVLNLVFFSQVRSKIKFLQMIGRGTRLSTDVFGPGMDKQGFLVFDYYDNFRYFNTRGTWSNMGATDISGKSWNVTPQSILLNQRKLSILYQLQQSWVLNAFDTTYRDALRDSFISEVQSLQNDDIEVQYHIAIVNKYRTAELWDNLTENRCEEIKEHILPLIPPDSSPVKAKNFDLLMFTIQDEYKQREAASKDVRKIRSGFYNVLNLLTKMMNALLKLKTIPDVMRKEQLIVSMIDGKYLMDNFSFERAESIRKELRELMAYIPDEKEFYVVDFADMLITGEGTEQFTKEKTYQEKVQDYIDASKNPVLMKLRNLDELTDTEKAELDNVFMVKLGTAADYAIWAGSHKLLPFLRIHVGIDDAAIENKFGAFLNSSVLDDAQLNYMNQIIGYTRENGDVTFMTLQNTSPFCDVDIMELFGDKVGYIKQLINDLHKPVM